MAGSPAGGTPAGGAGGMLAVGGAPIAGQGGGAATTVAVSTGGTQQDNVGGQSGTGGAAGSSTGSSGAGGSSGSGEAGENSGTAGSIGAGCSDPPGALPFVDIGDLPAPAAAAQLIYAPRYGSLILRNSASSISVVDIATGKSAGHLANVRFTDISLSPDGRYVFASDYGGENIGYSTPYAQSYVHRLDLADGSWGVQKAYIAGGIEAISADRFVLKSSDQWITLYYDAWSLAGIAASQLSSTYGVVYYGDFSYDSRTGRLLHGGSGSSSQEINAFRLVDDTFVHQEGSGTYGSASGFGGTATLATDGSRFYYGALSVDAQDVTHNLGVFPESIYAATGAFAFGRGTVYDVQSRELVYELGFDTIVYAPNSDNSDFWTFDSGMNQLRHFALTGWCGAL